MNKILKMDLYRLRKDKLLLLICAVAVILTLLLGIVFALGKYALILIDDLGVENDIVDYVKNMVPLTYTAFMEEFFRSDYTTMFIMLFAIIFYGKEYSKGYIKNIAAKTRGIKGVLSKLLIIMIAAVIIYVLIAIVVTLVCLPAGLFRAEELPGLIKVFFTGILLNLAISSFITMLFTIWQKMLPTVIAGISYAMVGGTLLSLMSMLVTLAGGNPNFDLNRYLCIGNLLVYLKADGPWTDYVRMIAIALVVLCTSTAVSAYMTKKRDIS